MTAIDSGRKDPFPAKIGRYQLAERVGQGGMGSVYRAQDELSRTTVALKLIHPHLEGDPDYVARFEREARIASLMRCPNVVHVLDAGTADGHHYMATEFIEGCTLTRLINDGPIEHEEALALAVQVARALDEAHQHRVVHRDIKPDNVMLTTTREVKVTDYGIARQRGVPALTMAGVFVGTFAYSAPERFVGDGDIRSDIYSLGVMLFQMIVGEKPYKSDTPGGMMRLHEKAHPPLELLKTAPDAVKKVVRISLEKEAERRYATPAAMIAAIEEARRSLSPAVPLNWVENVLSRLFDRRVAALIGAGAASVAVGGLFGGAGGADLVGIGVSSAGTAGGSGGVSAAGGQVGRGALQSLLSVGGTKLIAAAVVVAASVAGAAVVVPRASAVGGAVSSVVTDIADQIRGEDNSPAPQARAACDPMTAPVVGSATSDPAYAAEILALSNSYRAQKALAPLSINPLLESAAAEYARFFVETQFWAVGPGRTTSPLIHYGADCREHSDRATALGYPDTLVGENVMYADVGVLPPALWANLLSGTFEDPALRDPRDPSKVAFSETGVACFTRPTPEPPQLSCVQVFGQAE